MGLVGLLIKHRYGVYGLLTYLDLEFALSIGIVLSYNIFFPATRNVILPRQQFVFNLTITLVSIILVVLVLRNIPFGIGQDFYDGTIITFLQMKGRKKVFFYSYVVDVILPGIFFIFSSLIIFYLASFNTNLVWILEFLSSYLFLCNISYIITILTKRPFRAFFLSVVIILLFLGLEFMGIFNYPILLLSDIILLAISYYSFKGASV